jgi:hypothetical protein
VRAQVRPVTTPRRRADAPRINARALVALAVAGQVANPLVRRSAYRVGRDGVLRVVPGTGGIALNKRVGDRATGLAADHVEPGVALRNNDRDSAGTRGAAHRGLLLYSCVGNVARVVNGPAAGARGTVTGKHGGINNVLVDFPAPVLRRLNLGDRVQITAFGQGLRFPDFPDVRVYNLAPRLLARWGIRAHGPHLDVPVTHIVPAGLLGSGLGRSDSVTGDVDIQLSNTPMLRRFRLDALRFGDFVAICPLDARFGASRKDGMITVGIVVHSDSHVAGHGPGVTPLLIASRSRLRPIYSPTANIAVVLGLRRRLPAALSPSPRELRSVWRLRPVGSLVRMVRDGARA